MHEPKSGVPSPFMSLPWSALATARYSSQVVGGFEAGCLEHVLAVVHHVEVAIEGDHVDLAVVLLGEVAEERADVVLLRWPCRRRRAAVRSSR